MACPVPPLAPRCVAARRKDVRLMLCALLRGPPVAALRLLRAAACQRRCSRPCWTPPPPPDEGAGPPKGIAPSCCCSPPPPLYWHTPLSPPPSPWDAPRDGGYSSATTPCAPCMTCMLGPVLITQGLHRAPWLPYSFPPHPLCPLLWGGGGGKPPLLPRHGPGGGGGAGPAPRVRRMSPPPPPARRPLRDGTNHAPAGNRTPGRIRGGDA